MIKARFDDFTENVPSTADCVWDQYGNSTFFTCGVSSRLNEDGVEEYDEIWSDEQIAFAERYQDVAWDDLVPYGPFMNPKWKLHLDGVKVVFDDVIAEAAGETLHLMEIETAVKMKKSEAVHERITKFLEDRDVVICQPLQLPKTLRLFAALDQATENALSQKQTVLMEWGAT